MASCELASPASVKLLSQEKSGKLCTSICEASSRHGTALEQVSRTNRHDRPAQLESRWRRLDFQCIFIQYERHRTGSRMPVV